MVSHTINELFLYLQNNYIEFRFLFNIALQKRREKDANFKWLRLNLSLSGEGREPLIDWHRIITTRVIELEVKNYLKDLPTSSIMITGIPHISYIRT